ncbi:MAG: WD40/YVTN/BNR-like repeat-containing protein [Bacteroidia bacterium]
MHRILFLFTIVLVSKYVLAQPKVQFVDKKQIKNETEIDITKINWRGLCVLNNKTVWISGTNGIVAISNDGGNNFILKQIAACTKCDLRDIEVFDEKTALVINSGYPAVIFKTTDGGNTWIETFRKNDSSYFLDAMDFWDNKRGMLLADPIDGKFVLLSTFDGGSSWSPVPVENCPVAYDNEAAFAASGTAIRCWGKNAFAFVSGGSQTKLFVFSNGIAKHEVTNVPLVSGKSSQGSFSLSKPFGSNLIAVSGGDYKDDMAENSAFAVYRTKNPIWLRSNFIEPLTGYKSCIEFIGSNTLITCGTQGVDLITMKNQFFENTELSNKSFNTVKVAKKGNAVFLVGNKGVIAKLVR